MIQKWDDRYKDPAFAYGKEPNAFFRSWLSCFLPGSILLPAEGEGRNAVFAAASGWQVTAFDQSTEGRNKALLLAAEKDVRLQYLTGDLTVMPFAPASFDAIALIYAHFDANKKEPYHRQLINWLKPGGIVILEAFSKSHLDYLLKDPRIGGPNEVEMLYSMEEISKDFHPFKTLLLTEEVITLQEGIYHNGKGSVIRFVGQKQTPPTGGS